MSATEARAMTAAEIRSALAIRWPDAEYQRIEEAPQDASRQGRKIDVLVISLWPSRGHDLDAVEIKVSMSDWKRELDNPHKADWWWQHTNRYWIACPVALAPRIREQLPPTWGLLACSPDGVKTVVAAPRTERAKFAWGEVIGLIRAAADAGPAMLQRHYEHGRQAGYATGKLDESRRNTESHARSDLEALRKVVAEFEAAAGISITDRLNGGARLGALVKMLSGWEHNPERICRSLEGAAEVLEKQSKALREITAQLASEVVV